MPEKSCRKLDRPAPTPGWHDGLSEGCTRTTAAHGRDDLVDLVALDPPYYPCLVGGTAAGLVRGRAEPAGPPVVP